MKTSQKSYSKKTTGISYEQIVRDVRSGVVKPIYLLMGEESYYIDHIADFIVNTVLKPEEKDFNLITFFGSDVDVETIISAARAYPMGAQRLVVQVKEAQNLKHIDRLEFYMRQMQLSTVLILCYKNGTVDKRLKVVSLIQKEGILFESKKLYDSQLPPFVRNYLARKKINIVPEAAEMIAEFIGSDLNRIASELDKLLLALPHGENLITKDLVKQQIGMSKNFNIFELQEAIGIKDIFKVNSILKYFDSNPKENPIQMVLPSLFRYFSNIMLAFYSPDKSENGIATWLNMSSWQVKKNVLPAMKHYSGVKVMNILSEIRRTDGRAKGIGNPSISNGDLMKELFFFILH